MLWRRSTRRPWPLSPGDLAAFTRAGLAETGLTIESLNPQGKRAVTAVYSRPQPSINE